MQIVFIIIAVLAIGAIGLALYLYQLCQKPGIFFTTTYYHWDGTTSQVDNIPKIPDEEIARGFLFRLLPDTIHRDATLIEFIPAANYVVIRYLVHEEWQIFDLFVNQQQYHVQLIKDGVLTQCDGVWYLAPDYYELVIRQLKWMVMYQFQSQIPVTFQIQVGFPGDRYFDLNVVIDQVEDGKHVQITVSKGKPKMPMPLE